MASLVGLLAGLLAAVGGPLPAAHAADPWAVTTEPSISGTPKVGLTLTANLGATTPASEQTYVQWYRNGYSIGLGGTRTPTYTLTPADAGQKITIIVTYQRYSRDSSYTQLRTTEPVIVANGTFSVTAPPAVNGTPAVGNTLTADPGAATPAPQTMAYQWLRNNTAVPAENQPTYDLVPEDAGATISVEVTSTYPGYDTMTQTASTPGSIAPGTLTPGSAPALSGTATVGGTLTVSSGETTPAASSVAYQWLRDGTPLNGENQPTYSVDATDVGSSISVAVTSRVPGYTPLTRTPAPTPRVAPGVFAVTRPASVAGRAKVGRKLRARPAAVSPDATVRYRWLRNGKAIAGATKSTYTLPKRARGKKVSVRILYTAPGYMPLRHTVLGARKVV